jgi:hypothetical protein
MQTCILCMGFVMEVLWQHWGNIRVDIRIGDNLTDVYLKKQALSCLMHVLAEEDAVCGMRRMCWISHMITHQPALVTFILQQDDFLKVQYGVLDVRISRILFMYNQYKGCSQRTIISVYGVLDVCYTRDCGHINFYAVYSGLMKQYLQEVVYTISTTCMYGLRAMLMLLVAPQSRTDLVSGPELYMTT